MTPIVSFALRTCTGLAALSLAFVHATEANEASSWSPYAIVSAETDDAHSSQALVELGTSIGAGGWIRGGVGRADLADMEADISTSVFQLGGGASIAAVDISGGFVHRADGDAFKQQDWTFALGWQFGRGSIGGDVFIRSADSETVLSVRRRRLDPREIRIVESIDGTGYGVHGDFDITPAVTAFASWMKYDYDIETNRPLLARFSLLNGSGITRSEAFLDRSFIVGMTYHFVHGAVTAQYLHDQALVEENVTDSVQLSTQVLIGNHWSITPMAGLSDNDLRGNTAFGGLAIGYTW